MSAKKQGSMQAGARRRNVRARRRPVAYHHGNLRTVLLDVAAELLETKGSAALSLREVARYAGVSQNAPYNHFSDKEALLAALAGEGFRELTDAMEGAVATAQPGTTAERIRALGRGYLDFALHRREHLRLMFSGEIADFRRYPDLMEAAGAAYEPIRDAVGQFLAEGNVGPTGEMGPGTATVAAWSMVHGLAALLTDHKVDPANTEAATEEVLIDQVLKIFVNAMRPDAGSGGGS